MVGRDTLTMETSTNVMNPATHKKASTRLGLRAVRTWLAVDSVMDMRLNSQR